MKNLLIYLSIFTLLTACGASANKENKSKEEVIDENAIPVKTYSVQAKDLVIPIQASGVVAAESEIKLSFKTGGVIEKMYVNEGSTVSRGQLLATLNMSEIEAQVNQAKLSVEKSNRDLQRAKNLYTDSVTTLEVLQNASTAKDLSENSLKIAQFNQRYSTIYSPVNGKVLRKFTESNELIGPSMPVFLIGSTESSWVVKVGLSDKDVVRVRLGDPAKVMMDAHTGVVFNATVSQIAQTSNAQTGTYEVELLLENNNKPIIAGFIAKAEIQPAGAGQFIFIPIGALVEADGDKGYVFILEKDTKTVRKRQVKIAGLHQNEVAISSGLEKGLQIVNEGTPYLADKAKVKIIK